MIPAYGRRVYCAKGRGGSPSAIPIPIERTGMAPKILCVESNLAVLESRCAVLQASGYDAASATPQSAEIVLRSHNFDLIVVSRLSDSDLQRVDSLAGGADMLVLNDLTLSSEMLFLIAQRLDRQDRA